MEIKDFFSSEPLLARGVEGLCSALAELMQKSSATEQVSKQIHYIIYQNAAQQALFKLDNTQQPAYLWFYDVMERPMPHNLHTALSVFFKEQNSNKNSNERFARDVIIKDVSGATRTRLQKAFLQGGDWDHTAGAATFDVQHAYLMLKNETRSGPTSVADAAARGTLPEQSKSQGLERAEEASETTSAYHATNENKAAPILGVNNGSRSSAISAAQSKAGKKISTASLLGFFGRMVKKSPAAEPRKVKGAPDAESAAEDKNGYKK